MDARKEVETLLHEYGYKLVRQRTHYVYRSPRGDVFIIPGTPSDWRSWQKIRSNLRKQIAGQPIARRAPSCALTIAESRAFDADLRA
jgi:predicted RNA binding protein YcfA (HicA-like mRNA interferase family)